MSFIHKLTILVSFFLVSIFPLVAQDSLGAVRDWKVESKKIAEGKFELSFHGTISNAWQVYAPGQLLLDVNTTELRFADSSIRQEGGFQFNSKPKLFRSSIFEKEVSVFESNVEWKTTIVIPGIVPAKLQGSILYTYGSMVLEFKYRKGLYQ